MSQDQNAPSLSSAVDTKIIPDLSALIVAEGFESASRAILNYLHQEFGFKLWMTTRTEGDDWIVLQAENHGYDLHEGRVYPWSETLCARMLYDEGPRAAPSVKDVAVYAEAPLCQSLPIGAYVGVPMMRGDGSFLGTLCAMDPDPQDVDVARLVPLMELLARLLGIVLDNELKAVAQQRLLERTLEAAQTDDLTGLLNRRGWEAGIALEAARVRRYGVAVCVLVVEIAPGAEVDDALVSRAASCMRICVRESDLLARIDGSEFAVLALECGAMGSERLGDKLKAALEAEGIPAAVGGAAFDPIDEISETVAQALEAKAMDRAQMIGA
ncbi:sensor domain-containing diguanylate cyclase [Halothiobacillus diazotrophicus]|uniref:sensor domain-containing diguanylate cyclase n=1 Tax=Halothiobacillus diazotrophicus TaxID=1860122 RepID=UPI0018D42C00|nr:diguanylate cyclase [Halothiobacillus diazotrophicus]